MIYLCWDLASRSLYLIPCRFMYDWTILATFHGAKRLYDHPGVRDAQTCLSCLAQKVKEIHNLVVLLCGVTLASGFSIHPNIVTLIHAVLWIPHPHHTPHLQRSPGLVLTGWNLSFDSTVSIWALGVPCFPSKTSPSLKSQTTLIRQTDIWAALSNRSESALKLASA